MKKIITIFIMLFAIIVMSNAFAQSTTIIKSRETIINKNNQYKKFSPFNKQTTFNSQAKKTGLNPKSLICLYDSIYYWNWDTLNNGWDIHPDNKSIDFIYDANYNMTSDLYQTWSGTAWVNSELITDTYDVHNNLTNDLYQTWSGSAWVNSVLYTMTYDANNNQTSYLVQQWSGTAWVNSQFCTYIYDTNNNMTNDLGQTWSGTAWTNNMLSAYTYDAHNNETSRLGQTWSGTAWVNNSLNTYTYDANSFQKSFAYRYWNSTGTKITSGDSTYYYFHTAMGINEMMAQGENITVYPNPATDNLTIDVSATLNIPAIIEISNIEGQLIETLATTGNKTNIDVSKFAKGMYFVKVRTEKTVESKKFIKL